MLVSQQGEPFVAIESSRTWGFPCRDIALYVATVEQGTVSQPGYARATKMLCRDSVVLCCVAIQKTMPARQTRSGAHERYRSSLERMTRLVHQGWARMTGILCRDRLRLMVKKKKTLGIGASHKVCVISYFESSTLKCEMIVMSLDRVLGCDKVVSEPILTPLWKFIQFGPI